MGNAGIDDVIRQSSPEYQMAYTDGFEACKRATVEKLKALTKQIEELEAYVTSTSTVTTHNEQMIIKSN